MIQILRYLHIFSVVLTNLITGASAKNIKDPAYKRKSESFNSKLDAVLKMQNNRSSQNCDIIREFLDSLFKIPVNVRWNSKYDCICDFNKKVKKHGEDTINKMMVQLQLKKFTRIRSY